MVHTVISQLRIHLHNIPEWGRVTYPHLPAQNTYLDKMTPSVLKIPRGTYELLLLCLIVSSPAVGTVYLTYFPAELPAFLVRYFAMRLPLEAGNLCTHQP